MMHSDATMSTTGQPARFVLAGRTITVGDTVEVRPSRPGRRDGFDAVVIAARLDHTGAVAAIDVYGGRPGRAPATRTLRPERIGARRRTTR
jgi:hypothetical protein